MIKNLKILFFIFMSSCCYANQAMVATEQHLATQIGVNILKSGGNAVDAAVAVGYALAVVNPCCGNIGGGGFMTLHLANGKNIFLNFRERAPFAAKPDMFLDKEDKLNRKKSVVGYLAVATPGTVLGLETALKRYGTMTRQQVMAPAIQLAEKGFVLSEGDIKLLSPHTQDFAKEPNVAAIFLKNNKTYQVGDRLVQKDLANSLRLISEKGAAAFYQGEIGNKIVASSKRHGGILSRKDFAEYTVTETKPIVCHYHQYTIISAPPPSSGGVTLCEMLNILEKYPLAKYGFQSSQSVHYIVEAMRYAFYDRNTKLGDPDFVKNPVEKLISKKYAKEIQERILPDKATPSSTLVTKNVSVEGMHTTHYSILDKHGNAVSLTYTLNSFFGAGVIAGDTGFFLNNEMDDFAAQPGEANQFELVHGTANVIEPGKRPLSSMTPTIVLEGDQVRMVVGAPGGPRIITATLETILNVLDYGMSLQAAVDAPRFHHQWLPDVVQVEPDALTRETKAALGKMGYWFEVKPQWSAVEAIYVDPKTEEVLGANDKRRGAGAALGY